MHVLRDLGALCWGRIRAIAGFPFRSAHIGCVETTTLYRPRHCPRWYEEHRLMYVIWVMMVVGARTK